MAPTILCDGTPPWQGVKPSFNGTPQSLRFSASSSGTPVRGLTSRAESNGPVGSLNHSLSVLSACSASHLTHEARLRREFQRLGVNLPLQGQRGPGDKEGDDSSEGARLKSADVGVDRFGLNTGPSAALGSVTPEERLSNGRGRNALFPETFFGRSRKRVSRGLSGCM